MARTSSRPLTMHCNWPMDKESFIAGGGEALPDGHAYGGTHSRTRSTCTSKVMTFPEIDPATWVRTQARTKDVDDRHAAACTFETWMRQPTLAREKQNRLPCHPSPARMIRLWLSFNERRLRGRHHGAIEL